MHFTNQKVRVAPTCDLKLAIFSKQNSNIIGDIMFDIIRNFLYSFFLLIPQKRIG